MAADGAADDAKHAHGGCRRFRYGPIVPTKVCCRCERLQVRAVGAGVCTKIDGIHGKGGYGTGGVSPKALSGDVVQSFAGGDGNVPCVTLRSKVDRSECLPIASYGDVLLSDDINESLATALCGFVWRGLEGAGEVNRCQMGFVDDEVSLPDIGIDQGEGRVQGGVVQEFFCFARRSG